MQTTEGRRDEKGLILAIALLFVSLQNTIAAETLPSWNNTAAKRSILAFVEKVTKPNSADFVTPSERIAVFDNDGTLWAEKPAPFELLFTFDRVKALVPQHPEWKTQEPFASALRGDMKALFATGEKGVLEILAATHSGMSPDDFKTIVTDWIATARHPQTRRHFTDMVYQPMLELLNYLRANIFKIFIVSGGGVEFMRPWTERVYGIPPEQVIGSSGKLEFTMRDGEPILLKLPAVDFIDDKKGKPIAIQSRIGRHPIAAFGNSDGDQQMLEWATAGGGARFALLVHHDDAKREYAYDRSDPIQQLDKAWDEAIAKGWTIASMKDDWKTIFPTGKPSSISKK